MPKEPTRRNQILDVAERMIRLGGYNAFSTRLIAKEVGIKAASVHHYFPAKSDIGVAVAERYTRRFLDALGDPCRYQGDIPAAIADYIQIFRVALREDRKLCLCAVLGAEAGGLPSEVVDATKLFFEKNIAWLTAALSAANRAVDVDDIRKQASHIVSSLEGAMIVSQSLGEDAIFENVADALSTAYRLSQETG